MSTPVQSSTDGTNGFVPVGNVRCELKKLVVCLDLIIKNASDISFKLMSSCGCDESDTQSAAFHKYGNAEAHKTERQDSLTMVAIADRGRKRSSGIWKLAERLTILVEVPLTTLEDVLDAFQGHRNDANVGLVQEIHQRRNAALQSQGRFRHNPFHNLVGAANRSS